MPAGTVKKVSPYIEGRTITSFVELALQVQASVSVGELHATFCNVKLEFWILQLLQDIFRRPRQRVSPGPF
jgi:hypothetical protein